MGLPFKERTLSFQKTSSSLTEAGKGNSESQLEQRTIAMLINLVIKVVTLPTAKLKELILPARAESSLAEAQLASKREWISDSTHLSFFPGTKSNPRKRSIVNPNQSRTGVGTQMDFSQLGTNPEETKSDLTLRLWEEVTWYEGPSPKPSSRYTTIWIPSCLQWATRGLNSLVKMYGAEERPNGRTLKQKYLTFPLKNQEKPKNDQWGGKLSTWW